MSKLSKVPLLLRSLRRPLEFRDRIGTALQVRRDRRSGNVPTYETVSLQEATEMLERTLGRDFHTFLAEPDLERIETEVAAGRRLLDSKAPFSVKHNGDVHLARFCYCVARALKPEAILETGVAYGVTSAYLLQALQSGQRGQLWSVDLPPLGPHADDYVGFLIPRDLRARWRLTRGLTKRILPDLLPALGQLDLFVQDSLHTYRTITDELTAAWPFLRRGGILIADDVGGNSAFADFSKRVSCAGCAVVQELNRDSMFGVLVKN